MVLSFFICLLEMGLSSFFFWNDLGMKTPSSESESESDFSEGGYSIICYFYCFLAFFDMGAAFWVVLVSSSSELTMDLTRSYFSILTAWVTFLFFCAFSNTSYKSFVVFLRLSAFLFLSRISSSRVCWAITLSMSVFGISISWAFLSSSTK